MQQLDSDDRQTDASFSRSLLAPLLLSGGLVLDGAVLIIVYKILFSEFDPPLLQRLVADVSGRAIPVPGGGDLVLPPAMFVVGSYGVVLGLLWVAASIGRSLLQGGLSLLFPTERKLLRSIRREFERRPLPVRIVPESAGDRRE